MVPLLSGSRSRHTFENGAAQPSAASGLATRPGPVPRAGHSSETTSEAT
jgi:hypothetical protein